MQVKAISKPSDQPETAFQVIFNMAWRQLAPSKLLEWWEICTWSFFAIYLGPSLFGFHNTWVDVQLVYWCYGITIVCTPLFIGPWVYLIHIYQLPNDEAIRTIPIPANTFIWGRMAAVGIIWLRMFVPLILMMVYFLNIGTSYLPIIETWFELAIGTLGFLILSPTIGPYGGTDIAGEYNKYWFIVLWILQFTGWVIFPIVWAFYLGSSLRRTKFHYFALYFLWPVTPALLWFTFMFTWQIFSSIGFFEWWPKYYPLWSILVGLGWIIPSVVLFLRASTLLGRRSQ